METIIEELEKLGLSKMEAMTYVTLVQNGPLSGYQIAKNINVARASIYSVLDALYRKGIVNLIPGETKVYSPEPPETVVENMQRIYNEAALAAKSALLHMGKSSPRDKFINIEGYDKVIEKAKEMLLAAEKEVIIHTDFNLYIFEKEFKKIAEKGVRVLVFSWKKMETKDLPIEFFTRGEETSTCFELRMMMVVDFKKCMIASNINNRKYMPPKKGAEELKEEFIKSEFLGTFTENRLMVHSIAEHIHFDIYLLKLIGKYGEEIIGNDIQIGTMMERGE